MFEFLWAYAEKNMSFPIFVVTMLVTASCVLSCPYFRQLQDQVQAEEDHAVPEVDAYQDRIIKEARSYYHVKAVTSFCKKTNFVTIAPSKVKTCAAYSAIKKSFAAALPTDPLLRANLFGAAVRLAFHDAGEVDLTKSTDKLGPDGCLSSSADNKGLIEATSLVNTVLEPIWQSVCDNISRADFWALFGKLVIEQATSQAAVVNFQYGRKDSVSCAAGVGRLPNAQGGRAEVDRVLVSQMGMTLSEAVTLMGAHSLGHTHTANSGYGIPAAGVDPLTLNSWDDTPHILNNRYYFSLALQGWRNGLSPANASLSQWQHLADPTIMLNTDMALAFPISTTLPLSFGQQQNCGPRTINGAYGCRTPTSLAPPSTSALCLTYAGNNAAFLQAFAVAYTKMTTVGYGVPANVDGATATGKMGTLTAINLATCPA